MWPFSPKVRTARSAGQKSGGRSPLSVEPLEDRIVLDNSLTTAVNFGTLSGRVSTSGFVGASDLNDYYRVSLPAAGSLNVLLSGLAADADLQVIRDANGNGVVDAGEVLRTSNTSGTANEQISVTLAAGTYFVRVYRFTGDTNYSLSMTA